VLVRMLVNYGENWPAAGDTIDLPDTTAQELIDRGEAVAAKAAPTVETAALADAPETAAAKRKPGRPRKADAS
jgi:hypothetical protein